MASQAKRIGRVLVWTRSSRRLTDLRKLDKRLCVDRRICLPWRKRFHRPTPPCRCMKCWKLSLWLCTGSFRNIILIRLNQRSAKSDLGGNSWSAGKALGALLFWWRHSQCNFWTRCFTRLGALWPTREVSLSVDRRGRRIYRGVAKRLDSPGRRGSNEGRGATGAATRRLET